MLIIDDGSPSPAYDEIKNIHFAEPFRLRTFRQENSGVSAARNRGLDEADPAATLIAFLDSDDIWPNNHLARAVHAIEEGFDFYFCDNVRHGHHDSHWRSPFLDATASFLDEAPQKQGLLELPTDLMIGLTLSEFPCQASTVVYRRNINGHLRFDIDLKSSGEDVLFLTTLLASAKRVCMDLDSRVECGDGVNMYFANLEWNSTRYLSIKVDILVTRRRTNQRVLLSPANRDWNNTQLAEARRELAFHIIRNLFREPGRSIRESLRLARIAPAAAILLPIDMIRVLFGMLTGQNDRTTHKRRS